MSATVARPGVLVSLVVLLVVCPTSAPFVRAQDTGLDAIDAEYHDLLTLFYRPLAPADLLQAGWSVLASDAARSGAPPPADLPELPADADAAFATFAAAYSGYLDSVGSALPADTTASDVQMGMAESLQERHTHYLSAASMRGFQAQYASTALPVGLGVVLGRNGDPPGLVTDVAPGGPAAEAGLQPGDLIVGADGNALTDADPRALAAVAYTGPAGSTEQLSIDRGGGPQTVAVTRGPFWFPPMVSALLPGGIGYLKLSDMVISGSTLPDGTELLADLDQHLDDFDAHGARALILDLRDNGGGSVQTADEVLGRFLPDSARSFRESDARGDLTFELAGGRTRSQQLPMAVLVNGGTASAAEITVSALREAHRAVLVGQPTFGAVASSELVPLPGGAGLQIAMAAAATANSNTPLDGTSISPDVAADQTPTVDDYRSGRDPQIEAAIEALASAPPPPVVTAAHPALSPSDLDQWLAGALPDAQELPANDRLANVERWQRLDFIHPNELIDQNGGAPDPIALQRSIEARGYQGSVMASYGGTPGIPPAVSVNVDLYATADGAHAATSTNDRPEIQTPIHPPVQLGDETVAYRGTWLANGSTLVVWRRGRLVFTVNYADAQGYERPDTLAAISQLVDSKAQRLNRLLDQ